MGMNIQANHRSLDTASRDWLKTRFATSARFDEPMSAHTSFRVGGPAEAYIEPESKADLIQLIRWSHEMDHAYLIVGDGTNLLVRDGGLAGLVINLRRCLKNIGIKQKNPENITVSAMAGVRLSALCAFAIKNGLKGMNFALGIPGSIGGGIMMNAGTSTGWMENVLTAVTILRPSGITEDIGREKLDFSYRQLLWEEGSRKFNLGRPIITEGTFVLCPSNRQALETEAEVMLKIRRKKQPTAKPSAGCFFKNPAAGNTAGELIDRAGLKGKAVGGAAVSAKHANFIINRQRAKAADIIELMTLIQHTVMEKFHVRLEPEVKIVGH